MTDAAASTMNQPHAAQFLQIWTDALAKVLAEIGGSPFRCVGLPEAPAELAAPGDNDLWVVAVLSGALRGEMSLRLPVASTVGLARVFMGELASAQAEVTSEYREAVIELLRQVGGLFATAILKIWGEVHLRVDAAAAAPSWPASSAAWFRAGKEDSPTAWIEIQLSAALVAALRAERTEVAPPAASVAPGGPSSPSGNVNLELLMDVELAVTLCFGSRRMLLRDILELNPGSVVELDRQVNEPVEVLLDGRVVARGEVVVLDGNYGLRVTEVAPAT